MTRILGAFVLGLAFAAVTAYTFYPLELDGALRRFALWRGGARAVSVGKLEAFERDRCEPGKPCRCEVLIHGLGDSVMTWEKILAAAPKGWKLVAVQLPGTAGSAEPRSYDIPSLADAVRDSIAPVCPTWTVVGNSLGGWIAGWLALRWPEGVRELILLDPAGLVDPSGLSEATARTLADPTPEKMKEFASRAYAHPRSAPDRVWPALVERIKRTPAAKIVAAMTVDQALDGLAARIGAPTVILWGESDRVIPREVGERFARLIPKSRLVPLPDCGHLPQRECPDAVKPFLWPSGDAAGRP